MRILVLLATAFFALSACQTVDTVTGRFFGDGLPPPDGRALVGEMGSYRTVEDDTLPDLARRFQVGFVELRAANPDVDIWLPGDGKKITIPTAHLLPDAPHEGIVINVPEMRLYYFHEDRKISHFPIGVGREGWSTPRGATTVVRKAAAPTWYPPASIRRERPELPNAVPPGPDNPLGSHALYLGWPTYLIHGTNEPLGVGRRVSHGCIRLYPEHIKILYQAVAKGTPVMVVEQPVKWAWIDGELFVEAHPTLAQADDIEGDQEMKPVDAPEIRRALHAEARLHDRELDEELLHRVIRERRGYPVRVTRSRPLIPWLAIQETLSPAPSTGGRQIDIARQL